MDDLDDLRAAWADACAEGPADQGRVVVDTLAGDDTYAESTTIRLTEIIRGLAARHAATGGTDLRELTSGDARGFVRATTRRGDSPSPATQHLRRAAIRTAVAVMRDLGEEVTDPTAGLRLPPKTRQPQRPLDPDELTLLRVAAASRTRCRETAVAAIALSEAGATTGEVATTAWYDLDLAEGIADLPGAGRTLPRRVALTRWGLRELKAHAARNAADPSQLVVYRGGADLTSDTAQAAITTRLRNLMRTAGLDDPALRPGSVRLCLPAAALADGGRVEDAARRLGLASLDITAEVCNWDWTS